MVYHLWVWANLFLNLEFWHKEQWLLQMSVNKVKQSYVVYIIFTYKETENVSAKLCKALIVLNGLLLIIEKGPPKEDNIPRQRDEKCSLY